MFMVETDCDVPGYREEPQYSDEELEVMANEELDKRNMEETMARDMPYVDYAFALTRFVEVATIEELRAARAAIDEAIVKWLFKAETMEDAAKAARAQTKRVMREFKIPDPTRKPRDDRGQKRK